MRTRHEKTLTDVDQQPVAAWRPFLRLLFDRGKGPVDGPSRPLAPEALVIGRGAPEQGIGLEDPRVSRQHATVWISPLTEQPVLEDSSRNGTFVNGERVRKAELRDGDIVRVGDSYLLLRYVPEDLVDAPVPELVGSAPSVVRLRRTIGIVAPTDATVLVVGESGTGKELVARAVHGLSGRKGPFVPVNCSAIPPTLAESQLFGHLAGSFTGARDHEGYFRLAHGGTLFLDEVGDLPLEVQPKLLRVLEERQVMPVSGATAVPVDVRVVAATNQELERALAEQRFRGDVYARLAEITISMPRLAERREDILPLFRLAYGDELPELAPSLVDALLMHQWRFNVRELFKVAKEVKIRAVGAERVDLRLVGHRFDTVGTLEIQESAASSSEPPRPKAPKPPPPSRTVMEAMLRESRGNISELSRLLGRSRRQVYRYIEMYGLKLEDHRD